MSNVLEAVLPNFLPHEFRRKLLLGEHFSMNTHDEGFLIVRPIENADVSALGEAYRATPEKVVIELLIARSLERVHLAALRVDAGHDVLDGTVFARRVHRLKDNQYGPLVLGV